MKNIYFAVCMTLFCTKAFSQSYAVVYNFEQIHKKGNLKTVLKSYLDGNGNQSYFLNDFNNSKMRNENGDENIGLNGNDYIFKDIRNKTFVYKHHIKLNFFTISDTINNLNWKFSDSTKIILKYKCQKASCVLNGRKFDVFFTSEIPFSDGPWKLHGLPGMILEAKSDDITGYFCYKAESIEIENTNKEFSNIYIKEDVITLEDFTRVYRKKYDEFLHKVINENGETRPLEKGFIEYYIQD